MANTQIRSPLFTLLLFFTLALSVSAQFQFFDQFFGGGGGGQQQQQGRQNVASDSTWFRNTWEDATCSDYLCPDTLACVAVPHHCPCPYADVEDKVELGDGIAVCASKGGFKAGEMQRKVELARKGML